MSEENEIIASPGGDTMQGLKKATLTVTVYIAVCFLLRYIAVFVITAVGNTFADNIPYSTLYIIRLAISGMFLQVLPSIVGLFMFGYAPGKDKKLSGLYTKPKNMGRAVGNLAAVFGAAQLVNIITMLIYFLFINRADFDKTINSALEDLPYDMPAALFMFFMLVVIAPVFEELMFRGFVMNALKPYGNGFSIIVSGVLFGLFHGNFRQAFYTAVMGIALGYIANVTNSILPTMIIHAILNGLSGIVFILMSTNGVQEYITNRNMSDIPDGDMIVVAAYGIYMVCFYVFAIVGIIAAVSKIKKLRRYKVPKVCAEIPNSKKVLVLVLSVPALISAVMIADTFFGFSLPLVKQLLG